MFCPYLAFHTSLEQTLVFQLVDRPGFVFQKYQHSVAKLWRQDSCSLFLGFLPIFNHYTLGELGRETTPFSVHCRRESLWWDRWTVNITYPCVPSPEFARSRTSWQAWPTLELCSLAQLLQHPGGMATAAAPASIQLPIHSAFSRAPQIRWAHH